MQAAERSFRGAVRCACTALAGAVAGAVAGQQHVILTMIATSFCLTWLERKCDLSGQPLIQ